MTQLEKMVADTNRSRVTQQPQSPKVRGFPSFEACVIHLIVVACLLNIAFAEPGNNCSSETQFLLEHEDGSTSCEDCSPCPPGQTLSIECGRRILSSALVTCVPCKLGMSFSSKHGTSVCTPCSSCAKDQVVLQNCSLMWDIKCDKSCYGKDRYYDDDKGDCFPCTKCCNDEQDVVENECKEKLGTTSNMICSFHSSINRCDKSTAFPQEPTATMNQSSITNDHTSPSQGSKREHTLPPTAQHNHRFSQTKATNHRHLLISISVPVALIIFAVIFVFLYIRKARQTGNYLWCNSCDAETGIPGSRNHHKPNMVEEGLEMSDKVTCNCHIAPGESMEPLLAEGNEKELICSCQQGSKLLSGLLDDAPYLQAISERLDTTLAGVDNYRAVAQHFGLGYYKISSAFKPHDKGPTTALIEWLAASEPELTVQGFATVVKQKAKRRDVALLLEEYDSNKKLENAKCSN